MDTDSSNDSFTTSSSDQIVIEGEVIEDIKIKEGTNIANVSKFNRNHLGGYQNNNNERPKEQSSSEYVLCDKSNCNECYQAAYFSCSDSSDNYSSDSRRKGHKKIFKKKETGEELCVHRLVSNNIWTNRLKANRASIGNLTVGGIDVSTSVLRKPRTERFTIETTNPILNREFVMCGSRKKLSLDDLTYRGLQLPPKGGLIAYLCLTECRKNIAKDLRDVLLSVTLRNIGAPNVQTETSLIVARVDNNKVCEKGIRYANYTTLDVVYDVLPRNADLTVRMNWKGPLPSNYLYSEKANNIYLFFTVFPKSGFLTNSSDNNSNITIVNTNTPDVTIVY